MTGEDKIIQLIQNVSQKIDGLEEGLNDLDKRIDGLDGLEIRMDRLEDRQEKLTNSVNGLKIHIENETDKNIQILIEQYNPNVERLDDSVKRVEKLEFDVDSIKKVVISHSHEINKLMSRK
ncbi:MAG TPA: hypothetical protein GX002_04210 [Clostridiales bacterium]|jgi:predicted  nucleic acid-binding Zn-ribbon protein|nr:hypothetical protein [Clostridiales bacterium]